MLWPPARCLEGQRHLCVAEGRQTPAMVNILQTYIGDVRVDIKYFLLLFSEDFL